MPFENEPGSKSTSEYLEDVTLIKQILREQEDRALLPPWAFFAWAAVTLLGILLSMVFGLSRSWSELDIVLMIWIPALVLGSIAETAGWVQFLRRESPVLFTHMNTRLFLSFLGVVIASLVLVFSLLAREIIVAGTILVLLAVCLFLLAVFSYRHLFLEAYVALASGTALLAVERTLPISTAYLISGFGVTALFLAAGIHSSLLARKRHG